MTEEVKIEKKSSKAQCITKALISDFCKKKPDLSKIDELCDSIDVAYEEEYAKTHVCLPADKANIAITVGDTVCWNDGTSMNIVSMEWYGADFWRIRGTDSNELETTNDEPETCIHVQDGSSVLDYIEDTRELLESDSFLSDAEYARKYGLFLAEDEVELRKSVNDHRIKRAFSLQE